MTRFAFVLFLLMESLNSFGQVQITGRIEGYSDKGKLSITIQHSYLSPADAETIEIPINKYGLFHSTIPVSNPRLVICRYSNPGQPGFFLYVEPNATIELRFEEDSIAETKNFYGELAKENRHLQEFRKRNTLAKRFKIRTEIYKLSKTEALIFLDSIRNNNIASLSAFEGTEYFNIMSAEADYIWAEDHLVNLLANHDSQDPVDFQFLQDLNFYNPLIGSSYHFNNYFYPWYLVGECIRTGGEDCSKDYLLKIKNTVENQSITNKEYALAYILNEYIKSPDKQALVELEKYQKNYPHSPYTSNLYNTLAAKIPFDSLSRILNDDKFTNNKDNTVLINFWASWCGPCIKKIPEYNQMVRNYQDRNFVLVNINLDEEEGLNKAREIISSKNFAGVHIFPDNTQKNLLDNIFNLNSLPRQLVFKNGQMVNFNLVGDFAID